MELSTNPKRYEGSGRWLIKIFSGLLLVILLGIHFVVNHLVAPGGLLTYDDVVHYYANPLVVAMEILFLITVVIHSSLGIRAILLDLEPSRTTLKVIDYVLLSVGGIAIAYGIWLALTVASRS